MSVIIIGSGGHKAADEVRKYWGELTPAQRQDAHDAEAAYIGRLQDILAHVGE